MEGYKQQAAVEGAVENELIWLTPQETGTLTRVRGLLNLNARSETKTESIKSDAAT